MISDLFMKKNMCEESKCPWILEHPWLKPNVQLSVLVAIAFIGGMIIGKVYL